jgi:hypothetical protein
VGSRGGKFLTLATGDAPSKQQLAADVRPAAAARSGGGRGYVVSVLHLPSSLLAAPALLYAGAVVVVALTGALHPDRTRRSDALKVLALLLRTKRPR